MWQKIGFFYSRKFVEVVTWNNEIGVRLCAQRDMKGVSSWVDVGGIHLFDEFAQAIESLLGQSEGERLAARSDAGNHETLEPIAEVEPAERVARMVATQQW